MRERWLEIFGSGVCVRGGGGSEFKMLGHKCLAVSTEALEYWLGDWDFEGLQVRFIEDEIFFLLIG